MWGKKQEKEFRKRVYLQKQILWILKIIMIITLLFFIYVMFMTAFRPTVMYNAVFNFMTEIEVILFLLYWIPTWIYLISIVVFFSFVNKITVVVSIVIGAI